MSRSPNILVVIVDDMGVHQLGCQGGGFYETPRLDAIAREGVRFDCAYSASPVCSPARAAIYTGLHPARLHLTNYIPGTEPVNGLLRTPAWRPFLPVEVTTLGDAFKAHGYDTAHFGKWHLAPDYRYVPGRPMDPESQGFDTVHVTRKPVASADPESDPHHVHDLSRRVAAFVAQPRERPFLCVLAHNALHRPELAPAALVEKYRAKPGSDRDCNRPVVAAMMEEVDSGMGRILDALRGSGKDRETIVVFTADHGAFGSSEDRKPLRGAKADLYEAGVRVPLLVRWSGRIAPGVCTAPVFGTDLYPTLLDLADLPARPGLDGVSLRQPLARPSGAAVHEELCWHFPHYHHLGLAPSGAIRVGRHKLVEWFEGSIGHAAGVAPFELYDLDADPGEHHDLAADVPEVRADLAARLAAWRRRVGAQEMTLNPNYDPTLGPGKAAPPPGDPGNPYGE